MADDNIDDDIFDDLYDEEPTSKPAAAAAAAQAAPAPAQAESGSAPAIESAQNGTDSGTPSWQAPQAAADDLHMDQSGYNGGGGDQSYDNAPTDDDNYGPINVKEDGTANAAFLDARHTATTMVVTSTQYWTIHHNPDVKPMERLGRRLAELDA